MLFIKLSFFIQKAMLHQYGSFLTVGQNLKVGTDRFCLRKFQKSVPQMSYEIKLAGEKAATETFKRP